MIGKTISHYKILEKLGEGGMGVVYKAEDTKLDRLVALKFLPKQFSVNEEEKARFIHEAKASAALEHPNICNIHEIDETEDGQLFIVMAHYEGETLKEKIEKGPLKLDEAIYIAIQVAEGLNKAHTQEVIHRDIKSANIIITAESVAKILDFGLAKLKGQTKLTKEGTTLGTVAYMSPEQAKGGEADQRSDIWSLGVVLYEMITGQLPFQGEYDQAIMYAIMNDEPEPLTGLRTGVPMELERIINKTLSKDPKERYQGAADLLVDLRKAKKDSEPEVHMSKTAKRQKVGKRASPKLIVSTGLILMVILAALLIWKPFSKREVIPKEKIGIAVVHFENRTGDKTFDHLKLVIPDLLITSLEQSEYFSVMTWERMQDLIKQMGKKKVEFIDKDLGFELCLKEGIKNLVLGSYTKLGNTFALDVKVMDVESKKLLRGVSSKGKGEQSILDIQIDKLSKQISEASGLSDLKINDTIKPIRDVTTPSMDAYNYFVRGRKEREVYNSKGALNFLNRAVESDPAFAMAHYELTLLNQSLGNVSARNQAIEKAMKFSKKATKKEKLWIESVYCILQNRDIEKRFDVIKKIAEEYPKDKRAHNWLGAIYKQKHMYGKAITEFKKALELDPSWIKPTMSLGYLYSNIGNFKKAIEYNNRGAMLVPGDPWPTDASGYIFFLMGKLDDSIERYKETAKIRSFWGNLNIAYIYALKENYTESLSWMEKDINININIAPSQIRAGRAIFWKAFYNYWLGRYQQSLNDLNRVTDLDLREGVADKPVKALADLLRGWIHYDRGELERARHYIKQWYDIYHQLLVVGFLVIQKTEITAIYRFFQAWIDLKEGQIKTGKSRIEDMTSRLQEVRLGRIREFIINSYNLIMSEVYLVEGKPKKTIDMCRRFIPATVPDFDATFWFQIINMPYIHDTLARAYVMNGDLDQAINEYERLITFDPASKDRRLIHPRYHYRLAKLYDQKGMKEKAVKSFNKFISLWKDCDQIYQHLITDARKRVKKLEGKR